jgi:hypothetical protein
MSCARVPGLYLKDTKKFTAPELPEAPLIVFINSKSGGRAGPKLTETLYRAIGHAQVMQQALSILCDSHANDRHREVPQIAAASFLLPG